MSHATSEPMKVAVVGLGTVGRAVAEAVAAEPTMRLTGVVDLDPAKAGRRLADLSQAGGDVTIFSDVEQLAPTDVAIVCGGSHLDRVAPTLRQLMRQGTAVVSTCEEMTWPWFRHPHLSDVLAGEARKAGVAIVGGGVHPGFGFDCRPLTLARAATGLRRVSVRRVVDLNACAASLVRRSALGKTVHQFTALAKQRLVGQVGLGEYVVLIAQALGKHPTSGQIGQTVLPLPAQDRIDGPTGPIEAGAVSGIRQRAAFQDDHLDIEVELTLTLHPQSAGDDIQIDADPPVSYIQSGSCPAEQSPEVTLLEVAPQVRSLPPGLHTVLDLPPASPHRQEPA